MKRGLFSVSYAGFWGQDSLDLDGFIRKAGDLGYDGVLLAAKRPHVSVVDFGESEIDALRRTLEDAGVQLIGLAAYTDFLLPSPGEIPVLEMQEHYVNSCIDLCARLGGDVVRVFTGYDRGDLSRGAQEASIVEVIQRCGHRASDAGIVISLQNHHDIGVDTRELTMILDAIGVESVHAGFDAWSPHLRGEDLYEGARSMATRMTMTICADYVTFPRYRYEPSLVNYQRLQPDAVKATRMGAGEIDYDAFFRGLGDGGFDGWVVYEMCSPIIGGGAMANLDSFASAFLDWLDARA